MQLVRETKMHKDLEPWERSVRPCRRLFDVCLPGLALPDFRYIYECFVKFVDPGLVVPRRPSVAVVASLRSNGVVSSIIPCLPRLYLGRS